MNQYLIKLKKLCCFSNFCSITSISYSLPGFFLLVTKQYILASLFILLSIFAFLNHTRHYTPEPIYDIIDIIDRILIIIICFYFIYNYYNFCIVWIAISYMIVVYFLVIPKCNNITNKQLLHCSFHLVTSLSALSILIYKYMIVIISAKI